MTFATYAPRVNVHPSRRGSTKTAGPNLWLVLHTSEGGEGHTSAESLGSFMTTPATATNVASYHAVFDTDRVIPCVPDNVVAYSAGGGNAQGIHGCFPGKAGQTREQWLDPISRAMINQCARWLCDKSIEWNIPITRITPAAMQNYQKGIADHYCVTLAFRKTDHTDVGPNFPWDVLASDINALLAPTPTPTPEPPGVVTIMERFNAVTPSRPFDTRGLGGVPVGVIAAGQYGVSGPWPLEAKGVKVGVKVFSPQAVGYATVWRGDTPAPNVSPIDYFAGQTVNTVIDVPLAADRTFKVFISQNAGIAIDYYGYWTG